jgi:hypothetical protein
MMAQTKKKQQTRTKKQQQKMNQEINFCNDLES